MNAYLGKIAVRGAGINPGPGVHVAPLRPIVFPISPPMSPPSTIPLSSGENLEPTNLTSSPHSGRLASPSGGPLTQDAALPSMAGHVVTNSPKVASDTAPSPIRTFSSHKLHAEDSKSRNLKVILGKAGSSPNESLSGKAGLVGTGIPAPDEDLLEEKPEAEPRPATPEFMEISPGAQGKHPAGLEKTQEDNVAITNAAAEESLRPVVQLEPALKPGTSLTAKQLSSTATGQGNIFEMGDLPNFPHLQKAPQPSGGAEVRVTIGQVNVQVAIDKPQGQAPKVAKSRPDPFASLSLARRGWHGFFLDF